MEELKEFDEIDNIFPTGASFTYFFGRTPLDESDEFFSKIEKIKESEEFNLSKSELRILYPIGSNWEGFDDWVSYFGIPFFTQGIWWYALGKNSFNIHPKRGAYPIGKAYIYNLKNLAAINLLKFHISQFIDEQYDNIDSLRLPQEDNIIETKQSTPEKFKRIEKAVLSKAKNEFEKGNLFYFRTLLISESLIPESLFASIESNKETKRLYLRQKKYLLIRNEMSKKDDLLIHSFEAEEKKEENFKTDEPIDDEDIFSTSASKCSIKNFIRTIVELIREYLKKEKKRK